MMFNPSRTWAASYPTQVAHVRTLQTVLKGKPGFRGPPEGVEISFNPLKPRLFVLNVRSVLLYSSDQGTPWRRTSCPTCLHKLFSPKGNGDFLAEHDVEHGNMEKNWRGSNPCSNSS